MLQYWGESTQNGDESMMAMHQSRTKPGSQETLQPFLTYLIRGVEIQVDVCVAGRSRFCRGRKGQRAFRAFAALVVVVTQREAQALSSISPTVKWATPTRAKSQMTTFFENSIIVLLAQSNSFMRWSEPQVVEDTDPPG